MAKKKASKKKAVARKSAGKKKAGAKKSPGKKKAAGKQQAAQRERRQREAEAKKKQEREQLRKKQQQEAAAAEKKQAGEEAAAAELAASREFIDEAGCKWYQGEDEVWRDEEGNEWEDEEEETSEEEEEPSQVPATRGTSAVATVDPFFAETMGSGNEEVTGDDMSTPWLAILQPQSGACMKESGLYDENASPGDFIHTISREIWGGGEGVFVIPAHYTCRWVLWTPRKQGGGFIRQMDVLEKPKGAVKGDILVWLDENEKPWQGQGDPNLYCPIQAVKTHLHYLVVLTENGPEPVAFGSTVTQLTPSAKWNALINAQRIGGQTLARFSSMYKLTTVARHDDDYHWHVFKAELERRLDPSGIPEDLEWFKIAQAFKEAVIEGTVEVAHQQDDEAPSDADSGSLETEPEDTGDGFEDLGEGQGEFDDDLNF